MHIPYPEFIEKDSNMSLQRMIHMMLQSITEKGIREGLFRAGKKELSMRGIYSRLFPVLHNSSAYIEAHRLKIYMQDGMEKEALEQIRKIKTLEDKEIFSLLNYSFLFAITRKMPNVVEAFFSKGFPRNVNVRVFGGRDSTVFPTYFHLALATQNLAIIMQFFKRTVNTQETWHGLGPVHLAAVNPDLRVLDMVLRHGGNLMEVTTTLQYSLLNSLSTKQEVQHGETSRPIYPVDLAAVANNWGVFLHLMTKSPKSVAYSQHLLHILNSLEMVIKAINIGARVDISLADGSTILHTKTHQNRPEMVAFYLALKAPAGAANKAGFTPLSQALEKGRWEIAWILVMGGVKLCSVHKTHPIIKEIEKGWMPGYSQQEKYEYYKHAASYVEVVEHKQKSRFSIKRMLAWEKATIEREARRLNQKINKMEKDAKTGFKGLSKDRDLYNKFVKEVVNHCRKEPPSPS